MMKTLSAKDDKKFVRNFTDFLKNWKINLSERRSNTIAILIVHQIIDNISVSKADGRNIRYDERNKIIFQIQIDDERDTIGK